MREVVLVFDVEVVVDVRHLDNRHLLAVRHAIESLKAIDVTFVDGTLVHDPGVTVVATAARDIAMDTGFEIQDGSLILPWAIERVAMKLESSGARDYLITGGGHVLSSGTPTTNDARWRVGIPDAVHGGLVTGVDVNDHAVSTAIGNADELAQVTVTGPSLVYAAAYAIAALYLGIRGINWVKSQPMYGAHTVTKDGERLWTPEFDRVKVPTVTTAW